MPGPMQVSETRRAGIDPVVLESARLNAKDSYLAALLLSRAVRGDLIALAAFEGEIDRIPREVREPALADIRLQWWHDWIADLAPGRASGSPIADALADVVLRHDLDRNLLFESILARSPSYEPALAARDAGGGLEGLGRTGPALQRVAHVLGERRFRASDDEFLTHAGLALDAAREGMRLQSARADVETALLVSQQALAAARRLAPAASATVRRASLTLALVEPYLRALQKAVDDSGQGNFRRPVADILPLTRVWRLGMSRLTGTF